ncbi:hypothetical protein [Bacillus sp. FJAT-45350]|uniref:hypothetical protein n=1 Tax=Bacillus sp. FJAT-45350 TaxID=2011014 RepID=UPI0011551B3D|nr:hypothetical protein [Bacillus sp. FJAT-45350]
MMFGMILFWGLLIFVGIYFIKNYMNNSSRQGNNRNFELLTERLVKGDITEEEYDRLKGKLNKL